MSEPAITLSAPNGVGMIVAVIAITPAAVKEEIPILEAVDKGLPSKLLPN